MGERRRGVLLRGREVQEDGDDVVKLLDVLVLAETPSRGGARARRRSGRGWCVPKWWSLRALVHIVPQAMPSDVWGLVLPGEVSTAVVAWLKTLWLTGNHPLKFTAVNLGENC